MRTRSQLDGGDVQNPEVFMLANNVSVFVMELMAFNAPLNDIPPRHTHFD